MYGFKEISTRMTSYFYQFSNLSKFSDKIKMGLISCAQPIIAEILLLYEYVVVFITSFILVIIYNIHNLYYFVLFFLVSQYELKGKQTCYNFTFRVYNTYVQKYPSARISTIKLLE